MKIPRVLHIALSLLLTVGSAGAAFSVNGKFARLDKKAGGAFTAGDYKSADSQWNGLLNRLNIKVSRGKDTKRINEQIEATLRHLGECALAQKNYANADNYLKQAKSASDLLQEEDANLNKDFQELSLNYHLIDLDKLGDLGIIGPMATAALSEFHPNKISVAKTINGHHISVLLADDVIKEIGAKSITQVGINKNMSFDLMQGKDGEIILANISGIRVHATFWVNIINSSLKLDQSQRPVALITAQKLGFSQSVSTPVPDIIYLPVVALFSQVKSLFMPPIEGPPDLVPVAHTIDDTTRSTVVPITPKDPNTINSNFNANSNSSVNSNSEHIN